MKNKLIFTSLLFAFSQAHASKSYSRLDFGVLMASERFSDDTTGSNKNDFFVGSFRYFTKVTEIGESKWEFVSDLRDKNDFFGKLNKEQLQLDNANTFQLRRLSGRWPNSDRPWTWTVGRFPVLEAGSVYTDGGLAEYRSSPSLTTSIFGGLNPKRSDQTYVQGNSNSQVYGLTTAYQSRTLGWNKNFYLAHALVTQNVDGQTDRRYLFHNMSWQWETNSRILTLMYLDFVPNTYVQVGNIFYQQEYTNRVSSQLSLLGVDVIEYTHRQGIRELLPSSPYRELSGKLDYRTTPLVTVELGALTGQRDTDHLSKTEVYLGFFGNKTFGPKWDSYFKIGKRNNFTSNDQFLRGGLGYFSRLWESQLDLELGSEAHNTGENLHPITLEASVSKYASKDLHYTLSAQRSSDERVTIYAIAFKVGYRFGKQEMPPVRDGAPPRGAL